MKLKIGVGLASTLLAISIGAEPANAHAVLVFSNPQIEQLIAQEPKFVEVEFDGNLIQIEKAKVNVLSVKDSSGAQIDDGNSVTSGPILKVGLRSQRVTGEVSVSWRVVSSDGHPVEGGYKFYVGVKSTSSGPPPAKETPAHENYFVHHKVQIAYFTFGFLVIGLWALISVRILRRRGRS